MLRVAVLLLLLMTSGREPVPAQAPAQPAWTPQNLQYFPKTITREALVQRMREFSFSLGVRCQYCHAGGDGVSLEGVNFGSDDKPAKIKARAMLRMVDQINGPVLAALPSRADPKVAVDCVTCHRGIPLPKTLQTTLWEVINKDGAAAATARYRELRANQSLTGRWNFGEWEINELARRLIVDGKAEAALPILEMNAEYYPKSGDLQFQIGELLLAKGMKDLALERFKAAVANSPQHAGAKRRIEELSKR